MKTACWFTFLILVAPGLCAQVTTGSLGGIVRAPSGERLSGAFIQLTHEATATHFFCRSNRQGAYFLDNLPAGGSYSLRVSFIGFSEENRQHIEILLGETTTIDLLLQPEIKLLKELLIVVKRTRGENGWRMVIDKERLGMLTTSGKDISEYLFYLPQARMLAGTESAVSFAGQNNRYNAFFVDGALNNDVFGLAASGTNGGQAGISPVPMESIEQLQVNTTSYDASIGNFTGAGINTVTRSGSNRQQASVYHLFFNKSLSGIGETGERDYYHRIYGFRWQGPIKTNHCFYFMNLEMTRDAIPRIFNPDDYRGNLQPNDFDLLISNLRSNYKYNPGGYRNSPSQLYATRATLRMDWLASAKSSFVFAARYMDATRTFSNMSTPDLVHLSNDGFTLLSRSISVSGEWKKRISATKSNKLLITSTWVHDDRGPNGRAFPRVRIYDGDASIMFGTDNSSAINLLIQHNLNLQEYLHWSLGRHVIGMGADGEYNRLQNAFIQHAFGNYSYASLNDFISGAGPSSYQLGYSITDSTPGNRFNTSANFQRIRYGVFVNDEWRPSGKFSIGFGMRVDMHLFPDKPATNIYFNDSIIPKLAFYHSLGNVKTGQQIIVPLAVSPRFYFNYQLNSATSLRGGIGIFHGRIPMAWPGGIYQMNGLNIGGFIAMGSILNRIRFRSDTYHQWQPGEFGMTGNKNPINLITSPLRMPSLLRGSFAIDHQFNNGWRINVEALWNTTLYSIAYTNINLLPPVMHVFGPDQRSLYSQDNGARIPVQGNSNPYDYIILLSNRYKDGGKAWEVAAGARKLVAEGTVIEFNYRYGKSTAITDGTSSINSSQWRTLETVNGKNEPGVSQSDFSPGHKITVWLSKKWKFKKAGLALAASYCGESGVPFSYVYRNSLVGDDGKSGSYDLVYVPASTELASMQFSTFIARGLIFSEEQQRAALEEFIRSDPYLAARRGQYAERNGSRTPFIHTVNVKLVWSAKLRFNKKSPTIELSLEGRNLLNLVNGRWGQRYLLPNDQLPIIEFAGFKSATDFTPVYRFDPAILASAPWKNNSSTEPPNASSWNCQLGCRISW